jgi:hypothetical protein
MPTEIKIVVTNKSSKQKEIFSSSSLQNITERRVFIQIVF